MADRFSGQRDLPLRGALIQWARSAISVRCLLSWFAMVCSATADDHWAFKPLGRPALPVLADAGQASTPLDAFIVAKLAERRLRMSDAAEPAALLRRACFDLIGLPPSPEEVDAFEADPSDMAWSKRNHRRIE